MTEAYRGGETDRIKESFWRFSAVDMLKGSLKRIRLARLKAHFNALSEINSVDKSGDAVSVTKYDGSTVVEFSHNIDPNTSTHLRVEATYDDYGYFRGVVAKKDHISEGEVRTETYNDFMPTKATLSLGEIVKDIRFVHQFIDGQSRMPT